MILQVVRGHMGELLQLGVRTGQLPWCSAPFPSPPFDGDDILQDHSPGKHLPLPVHDRGRRGHGTGDASPPRASLDNRARASGNITMTMARMTILRDIPTSKISFSMFLSSNDPHGRSNPQGIPVGHPSSRLVTPKTLSKGTDGASLVSIRAVRKTSVIRRSCTRTMPSMLGWGYIQKELFPRDRRYEAAQDLLRCPAVLGEQPTDLMAGPASTDGPVADHLSVLQCCQGGLVLLRQERLQEGVPGDLKEVALS